MLDAAVMAADTPSEVTDAFDRVVRERQARILRTAYRISGNWADAETWRRRFLCVCIDMSAALR